MTTIKPFYQVEGDTSQVWATVGSQWMPTPEAADWWEIFAPEPTPSADHLTALLEGFGLRGPLSGPIRNQGFNLSSWLCQVGSDTSRYWSVEQSTYLEASLVSDWLAINDPVLVEDEVALTLMLGQIGKTGPVQPTYRLYKLNFLERLSTSEAAILETALNAEEPKMRLMYNAAEYFQSDDSLFAYLHWVVAVALSSEAVPNTTRADELLAPVSA